ncbi:17179_t:CDS:2, partial [Funneliformis geosporum]
MIKVNDENFYSRHLKIPRCVAIDTQSYFKKFYFKAEKNNLTYYLRVCNLDNKVDLPIHRMNKYYERALKETNITMVEQMREVAKYCIIDALSCQRLIVKCNVINIYRELVTIAFLPLFDAYYFVRGLENKHPITGLDFASLYPSLIMTYNLSPDKIILSQKHTEQSGKKLHKISFKFKDQNILIWSIQHNNLPKEKALYANVLEYLFAKQNEIKKCFASLKEKKENMELVIASIGKGLSLPGAIKKELANMEGKKHARLTKNLYCCLFKDKLRNEFMAEYDSICFDCILKVYMNPFYSTARDSRSPFFLRELAGSVTSAGQKNIKLIADFIKSRGFQIKYGDTDSLYLVCLEECFQECDEIYDYEISMGEIEKLRDEINDFLRKDNGSPYLKMAYEKVLFLVVFTGKKKYYGIPNPIRYQNKEMI